MKPTHLMFLHSVFRNDCVCLLLQPVQLKLAAPKPVETVKKITVASAFSNNDSSDDDDEEEPPVKYSRNIGRWVEPNTVRLWSSFVRSPFSMLIFIFILSSVILRLHRVRIHLVKPNRDSAIKSKWFFWKNWKININYKKCIFFSSQKNLREVVTSISWLVNSILFHIDNLKKKKQKEPVVRFISLTHWKKKITNIINNNRISDGV